MLLLNRATGEYHDNFFRNLPQLLQPGDLLILNDSRVLPARLYATRARQPTNPANSPDPTGRIEVLLTQQLAANDWTALVRPSRKIQPGERLLFHALQRSKTPTGSRSYLRIGEFGERTLRFSPTQDFHAILEQIGHMPLPPYIHREDSRRRPRPLPDRLLHNTPAAQPPPPPASTSPPKSWPSSKQNGIQIETITLHVGLGTFQPVRAKNLVTSASTPNTTPFPPRPPKPSTPRSMKAAGSLPPAPPQLARSSIAPKQQREIVSTPLRPNQHLHPALAISSDRRAVCSPTSICHNPHCLCWSAPLQEVRSEKRECCPPMHTPSAKNTASSAMATACSIL